MRIQEELSTRLRMERAKRGLTVHEAAGEMGIAGHTLSALERGIQKPRIPTLSKIAKVYGWPMEELIGEEATNAGKGKAPESGAAPTPTQAIQDAGGIPSQEAFDVPDLINIKVETDRLEWVLSAIEQGQLSAQQGKNLLLVDASD